MEKRHRKPKLYWVRWLDSFTDSTGWRTAEKFDVEDKSGEMESVGWLIGETERSICITQLIATGADWNSTRMWIPKGCILERREIVDE